MVGIDLPNPFPSKCFAASFIEFEEALGIEWALAALISAKKWHFRPVRPLN